MKTTVLSAFAVLASLGLGFAQAPSTSSTGTTGGAKPKPLAAGDKSFVKNTTDSMYYLLNVCDKAKRNAGTDTVKKLGEKMGKELDKVWGEIGAVATAHGETLPSELKGSDKSNAEKLGKLEPAKFDKEFLDEAGKEMKKLARYFDAGSKSLQTPELKKTAETWGPTIKGFSDEIAKTEKEVQKAPR